MYALDDKSFLLFLIKQSFHLSAMRCAMQTNFLRELKCLHMHLRRKIVFIPSEIDADYALSKIFIAEPYHLHVFFQRKLTYTTEDQPRIDAKIRFSCCGAAQCRMDHIVERKSILRVQQGTIADLRVNDIILPEILAEFVRDAFKRIC